MNIAIEFCIFELVQVTKFQNKLIILIFWTKFTQKWYLRSKSEKVNITTEFCIFKLEENNYIFHASPPGALVYLAEPMHKKNVPQHLFGASHLVRDVILWLMPKYVGNLGVTLRFSKPSCEKDFQNLRVRLKFNTR